MFVTDPIGIIGEMEAAKMLEKKGFTIVELVIVAHDYVFVNHTEWANDIVVAQFCLWVNNC